MLDVTIMPALLWLGGAAGNALGFVAQETAKEVIKRYAPKALDRTEETVERIWSLIRQGDLKEAEREISSNGLTETIIASATELQRQTVILSMPKMENEYAYRVQALEKVVESIFEVSRQWRLDLLLPGGISDQCALTVFMTSGGIKYPARKPDLGFVASNNDRAMWILAKENCSGEMATELLTNYRDSVVALRKKSDTTYLSLTYTSFAPVLSVDGGAMNVRPFTQSDWDSWSNERFMLELAAETTAVPIGHWVSGVQIMEKYLASMPSLLQLDAPEERAEIQQRVGQLGIARGG